MTENKFWEIGVRHEETGTGTDKARIWSFIHIKNAARGIKLRMSGTVKHLDEKMRQAQEIVDCLYGL